MIVSGPSGAGKGTLIEAVLPRFDELDVAVSATTRPMRQGERDGREYHFMTRDDFERRVAAGEFLEHVTYAGNLYGTPEWEVERRLAAGHSVILEIELIGARAVRRRLPDAVAVFIAPPSMDELSRRLRDRGTEDEADIARRLEVGRTELEAMAEFDHVIVNEDRERAADRLADVVAEVTGAVARAR
ncbi:MAG: guanylate kinase [Actinomycetota bacterium]